MKQVVVISDLHCGSQVGLTPPDYQYKSRQIDTAKQNKYAIIQRQIWGWFAKTIKSLGKIDLLIVNGDTIDGSGKRSGGTEQIHTDRNIQVEMAIECIEFVGAKKIIMTYGTPYHTGDEEDFEDIIAQRVQAKIGSHEWIEAGGVVFDCKHHIGSSAVPHARATAGLREAMWNVFWSERKLTPAADIILRSHVHYLSYAGDGRRLTIATPAMQGYGTKYGSRRCSGLVDVGFLSFRCENGEYDWKAHIAEIPRHKAEVTRI